MLNNDGTRCLACGSISPEWIDANDYDGPDDHRDAYAAWESVHEDCRSTPEPRSIAPDAYTRTAVYLGERRDV